MRLSIQAPAIVSGIPIPDAENPLIAAPEARLVLNVELEPRGGVGEARLRGPLPVPGSLLGGFWSNIQDGLGEGFDAEVIVEDVVGSPGQAGSYAAVTVALLHVLARRHGDTLSSDEIVELARLADPLDYTGLPGWAGVLDALRYSAATGRIVAWRNDEEHGDIAEGGVPGLSYRGEARVARRIAREELGGDVYSAIVHLAGISTLAAAVKIRDGEDPLEVAWRYKPVDEAIALLVWGAQPPGEECIHSPGLPAVLEKHCKS
ncbi:MAG: hypothetical protein GSR80_000571 [Desulfurococcales archaeon]|nr:hypothetical protein [Desulfurococcales archaeon]